MARTISVYRRDVDPAKRDPALKYNQQFKAIRKEGYKGKVLMIGSGHSATEVDKHDYRGNGWVIVGVNHGWRATPKWQIVVHADECRDVPPAADNRIVTKDYVENLSYFGGHAACGFSIMLNASYWVLRYLKPKAIGYLGADMMYEPDNEGKTHFYGVGIDIKESGISDPDRMVKSYGKGDPDFLFRIYRRFEDVAEENGCKVFNLSSLSETRLPYYHASPETIDDKYTTEMIF